MKKIIFILLLFAGALQAQYLPAITGLTLTNGLEFIYQEGDYKEIPVFPNTLVKDTIFDFKLRIKRQENFAIQFEGFVKVPSDNLYTFFTKSDDGSKLWIDDQLVVDNDGLHYVVERSGNINLAAGHHRIKVAMFNAGGIPPILEVRYSSKNISKKFIPVSMLFRERPVVVVKPTPVPVPVPVPSMSDYYTKKQIDSIFNSRILYVQPGDITPGVVVDTLKKRY